MNRTEKIRWYLIVSGGIYSVLALMMVFLGRLHVDEGYYHLIAALTSEGSLPYRDYIYVQTPVYPFVYGVLFRFFGTSFVAARMISVMFGFPAFLLAVVAARKTGGVAAAFVTATLVLFQPFTIYYLTIVKLYALTGLILVILVFVLQSKLSPVWRYSIASGLASLAVSIRLTVLPVLPLVVIIALVRTRGMERVKTMVFVLLAGAGVLAVTMIPFQAISPATFYYSIIGYHLDKEGFSLSRQILHRFDTVFRLSRLYSLMVMIIFASVYVRLSHRISTGRRGLVEKWQAGAVDAGVVIGGVVMFHFLSQVPYVHRYLAMTGPAVAAIIGPEAVRLAKLSDTKHRLLNGVTWSGVCLIMCAAMGKPVMQFSGPSPVTRLKTIATEIELLTGSGDAILTFNNSVAVEANRHVLPGYEMNVLTYDPEWTRDKCELFRVLNVEMLLDALEKGVPRAVLITANTFIGNFPTFYNPGETGARPDIMYALEKHYHRVRIFPGFGFLGEDAELYLPLHRYSVQGSDENDSGPAVHIYRFDRSDH